MANQGKVLFEDEVLRDGLQKNNQKDLFLECG
jgi:hypothetical protein